MQLYFHSCLWSYLPRVLILVEGTVYIYIYVYVYVVKNNNRTEVFCVKQVVFGISLSVIKVLFSLTDYSLSFIQCSESGNRLDG